MLAVKDESLHRHYQLELPITNYYFPLHESYQLVHFEISGLTPLQDLNYNSMWGSLVGNDLHY